MKYTVLISWADYEDFTADNQTDLDNRINDWIDSLTGEEAKELLKQSNMDYQIVGIEEAEEHKVSWGNMKQSIIIDGVVFDKVYDPSGIKSIQTFACNKSIYKNAHTRVFYWFDDLYEVGQVNEVLGKALGLSEKQWVQIEHDDLIVIKEHI